VFVTGCPRSGTTLLKAIMEAHSRMCGPSYETSTIFSFPADFYHQNWGPIDLEDDMVRHILSEQGSDIVSFYDNVVQKSRERKGADVFVDKVWPRRYQLRYVSAKFPRARWIHIVRDGRDCYCSALRHPNVPQSESVTEFASFWKGYLQNAENILPDDRRFSVRYEDLVQEPGSRMASIMGFVGLDFEAAQVQASEREGRGAKQHKGAHGRLSRPITDDTVGRWREEMGDEAVASFRCRAGDMLREWRYSSPGEGSTENRR